MRKEQLIKGLEMQLDTSLSGLNGATRASLQTLYEQIQVKLEAVGGVGEEGLDFLELSGLKVPMSSSLTLEWEGAHKWIRTWGNPVEVYLEMHGNALLEVYDAFVNAGGVVDGERDDLVAFVVEEGTGDPKDHRMNSRLQANWDSLLSLKQSGASLAALTLADKVTIALGEVSILLGKRGIATLLTLFTEQERIEEARTKAKERLEREVRENIIRERAQQRVEWLAEYGITETERSIASLPEATEICCPPGTFLMGASPGKEKPAREVTLTEGFWALSTPVTQAMYEAVMGKNPSDFKGARRPVECVSWYDAVEFCNQLSQRAGLTKAYRILGDHQVEWLQDANGYRLPTEAEWEYLCRAGSTDPRYGELDEVAWFDENSEDETLPVGQKEPNAWGVFDTLGNVWEWCVDEWDEQAYSKLSQVNPAHVPHTVYKRVIRGGSWSDDAWNSRASCRYRYDAAYRDNDSGFRVIRTCSNTKV